MRAVLAILGLVLALLAPLPTVSSSPGDWTLQSVTFVSRTGGDVYPGSTGALLTVSILYSSNQSAYNPVACINLPAGFTLRSPSCVAPSNYTLGYAVTSGSLLDYRYVVDVSKYVSPGVYVFQLNVSYFKEGVLTYQVLYGNLTVSPLPPLDVEVRDVYWTPAGYPGAYPTSLVIEVENNGNTTITRLDAEVGLPAFIKAESNRTSISTLPPNGVGTLVYNGLAISPDAAPGVYKGLLLLNATLTTSDGVEYNASAQLSFEFAVDRAPNLTLQVVDYRFTGDVVLPGMNNTGVSVTIRSFTTYTIKNIVVYARVENGYFSNLSSVEVVVVDGPVNYGDVFTLVLRGVNLFENATFVRLTLVLDAVVLYSGSSFPATATINLLLPVDSPPIGLYVEGVHWARGAAYPNSAGNTLVVELYNSMSAYIEDSTIELHLPEDFYPATLVVHGVNVQPLATTRVEFADILVKPGARPGYYPLRLYVRGSLTNNDGSTKLVEIALSTGILVSPPDELASSVGEPVVSSYFWGYNTPQYVYPGNSMAPLTIIVYNPGPVPLGTLIASLTPLASDLRVLNNNVTNQVPVQPGSTASLVFYLDLSKASPGLKRFNLTLMYAAAGVGTYELFTTSREVEILLPGWEPGAGVSLVSANWLNGYPAYPNSTGAVYTVTLANSLPYQVSGVWLKLVVPEGLRSHDNYSLTYYVQGPVAPFQVFTASFVLDVGGVAPGVYSGTLEVSYATTAGGLAQVSRQFFKVLLTISDPSKAISVVSYGWLTGQPYPGERGAVYYARLLNAEFPVMNGVVVEADLPSGLVDAFTLAQKATGFTGSLPQLIAQYAQVAQRGVSLAGLISQLTSAQTGSAAKGAFVDVLFVLDVTSEPLENSTLVARVSFTDHWGERYELNISIPLVVSPRPPLLGVYTDRVAVEFANSTGLARVYLSNAYDYPVYDIYLLLIPQSMTAVPLDNVRYIEVLPPKSNATLVFRLVYNPVSVSVAPGVTASSPTAVFLVTVIYKDASGFVETLNETVAFTVKPFVDLVLTPDTNAKVVGGTLVVNGMIINTGVSRARSVTVYCIYGNASSYEFLGDLDAASQTGFRVEMSVGQITLDKITLRVTFKDEYNNVYEKDFTVPLTVTNATLPTPTPASEQGVQLYYALTVGAVALFLAGFFYLFYRKFFARRSAQ
ncbi:hypothetical protein [Thermogladius sp.]|uniref:hypothetical protein n=1 Tax=Thermogladius sp. TaxID=2023064 RepID=UPI003D0B0BFB